MKKDMFSYFINLNELFSKIEVEDDQGKFYKFPSGLSKMIKLIINQTSKKRFKIIFIGNGASASIASHQGVDFWKSGGMRAISFNDAALLTCVGNDYGYEYVFAKPLEMFAEKGDVLIAISSSGNSENILKGVRTAKKKGCKIITMSGFSKNNPLRRKGNINFYVPSYSYGPVEIIHLSICHCVLDYIVEQKSKRGYNEKNK